MTYKCICGQEFDNPQKFNRHKAFCKVHIESKGINYDEYVKKIAMKKSEASKLNAKLRKERLEQEKCDALKQWIVEQHTCEKCGKIMTEKYGSGRFCSKQCANTRIHSDETKIKISQSTKENAVWHYNRGNDLFKTYGHKSHEIALSKYNDNPNHCIVCGRPIPYDVKYRKTCSDACAGYVIGGFRNGSARNYKYGTYRDVWCDSSYELAFVVYCCEHSISFKRNVDVFPYMLDGVKHLYTPDFKVNDTYIEIKGFHTNIVDVKMQSLPQNIQYVILYEQDLKPCIDYCVEKYGKKYWEVLYDKNKPSCNDKKQA